MNEMSCDQAVLKLNAGAEVTRGAGCTCMQAACAKAVSQLHHRKERIQTVAPISHIPQNWHRTGSLFAGGGYAHIKKPLKTE